MIVVNVVNGWVVQKPKDIYVVVADLGVKKIIVVE